MAIEAARPVCADHPEGPVVGWGRDSNARRRRWKCLGGGKAHAPKTATREDLLGVCLGCDRHWEHGYPIAVGAWFHLDQVVAFLASVASGKAVGPSMRIARAARNSVLTKRAKMAGLPAPAFPPPLAVRNWSISRLNIVSRRNVRPEEDGRTGADWLERRGAGRCRSACSLAEPGHLPGVMMLCMLRRLLGRPRSPADPQVECFRAFFHEKFGHPDRQFTLGRDDGTATIDVEVHRAPWDRDVYVLASVGLSARTRTWGEPVEVILLVDDLPWEAERAFGRVVGLLADEPAALVIGNTFSAPETLGEIARRFAKTGMVLTLPQLGDLSLTHVECPGQAGHVLMLVPISDAERALIDESGLEAFESRLEGADVSDLERASVA